MMKILVTGANGFVGYYTIRKLLDKGCQVIATGKGPCRLPFSGDHFIYESLDFTDDSQVATVFDKYKPEVIIHSGAMSKPDECELHKDTAHLVNVSGTEHLLSRAAMLKAFFIFLSTDFVFDGKRGMYSEEDARAPVNYYGETKRLAEEKVKEYPFEWAIVRTVLVYGKNVTGKDNILTGNAKSLAKEQPLKIFTDQIRTPTYVEDLAGALVEMVVKKAQGVFHVSGKDILSPYEMVIAMARLLHYDLSLVTPVYENEFDQPARRPLKTGFDITKARETLGYQPVSFEEGLKKTFEN